MSKLSLQQNFDSLTALRGVLALWVVVYHLIPQFSHLVSPQVSYVASLGYIAVDFFFVLSGFVIAMTYQHQLSLSFTRKNLTSFYIKRFARIYPLHIAVMFLYLLYLCAFILTDREIPMTGRFDLSAFILNLLLMNNWGFSQILSWNVPSWSISTEFAGYILFPFIALFLERVRKCFLLFVVMALCCISVPYLFYQRGATSISELIPTLGVWRCLFEFTLGMVVYNLYRDGIFRYLGAKYLIIGMVSILFVSLGLSLPDYYWLPLFMILFISFFICLEAKSPIKVPRTLLWLGDVSYSVYLIHYFVKDVMKLGLETEQASWVWIIIYFVIVLGSSHLTYRYYELPAKRTILAKFLPKIDKTNTRDR